MISREELPASLNVLGLGIDIIEVERVKAALEGRAGERFEKRVFTEGERAYCRSMSNPYPHFAARFAAKEAVMKAFGTGWTAEVNWKGIEVLRNERGKPYLRFNPPTDRFSEKFGCLDSHVSLSHDRGRAAAVAIILGPARCPG